jgi:hypothetical protein
MKNRIKEFLIKLVAPDYYDLKNEIEELQIDVSILIHGKPWQKNLVKNKSKHKSLLIKKNHYSSYSLEGLSDYV